jgi:serine phosphatase RsbU (regulator of sigma subunit)
MDEPTGVPNVIRTGVAELYPHISDDLLAANADDEEHLAALRELGMVSAMIVPMVARQRTLGTVTLVSSTPTRRFDVDDLALAEELGRRAGVAVDNARLYSERTRVAETLQASLLPRALPHVPGVELASRFRPAGHGVEVGGDFYDVFAAAEGHWIAVIGDVCGKGAEAAGLTALARYTVRSLGQTEWRPAAVLAGLNRAVLQQEEAPERFLTVLVVSLEVGDGRVKLRLSAGGHPHPLLVRSGGGVEVVPVAGMLVGLFPDATFEERELELAPGETLMLYTDGLTDAQAPEEILSGDDVAQRLERAGAHTAQEVVAAAEEFAAGQGDAGPRDDIAVLALHVSADAG